MGGTYYLAGTASSSSSISSQFEILVDNLSTEGFSLVDDFPAEFFVSVNHNSKKYKEFLNTGGQAQKSVLLMLEPRAVYPSQYTSRVLAGYSLVLAPGNLNFVNNDEEFIPWPYEAIANPQRPVGAESALAFQVNSNVDNLFFNYQNWAKREYFISMINANKVSPVKVENYSLRRKFARDLDKNTLAVFGDFWNSSYFSKIALRFSILIFSLRNFYLPNLKHIYGDLHWQFMTSRGVVLDKQEILRSSKFSIVIENDGSYVSEKLFDSLINGCIPVYLGPKLPKTILPKGIFIDLPEDPQKLIPALQRLTDLEIANYLNQISSFISSSNFIARWDKHRVFAQCALAISTHFKDLHE